MTCKTYAMTLAIALTAAPVCLAQTAGGRGGGGNQRFEQNAPQIGATVPDLTVYDADGKEFRLHTIKGHYTVLVLGCLT